MVIYFGNDMQIEEFFGNGLPEQVDVVFHQDIPEGSGDEDEDASGAETNEEEEDDQEDIEDEGGNEDGGDMDGDEMDIITRSRGAPGVARAQTKRAS